MNQQEYQDTLKEHAMLCNATIGTEYAFGYICGWQASQLVQMYELLTPTQQKEFGDKLLYSLNRMEAEADGETLPDTSPQRH